MPKAVIEEHGSIAILRMQNGVTNPIGPGLVAALDKSLAAVEKEFGGMVLVGGEKFFSIKENRTEIVKKRYEARGRQTCERFIDCWFAASTRPLLEKAADSFIRR
jgi:hypothetical protein